MLHNNIFLLEQQNNVLKLIVVQCNKKSQQISDIQKHIDTHTHTDENLFSSQGKLKNIIVHLAHHYLVLTDSSFPVLVFKIT